MLRILTPAAENRSGSLILEGRPTIISGVPRLLYDIVYNLCDNGIKYNRPGGSVTARVEESGGNAVLTVEDTGSGIPPEDRSRVFERFYRVDKSRSAEIGGTGLDLSIVKYAARIHGARIELSSGRDTGTGIRVIFPGRAPDGIIKRKGDIDEL